MAVGERERRELQEALMEAIGPEQTDTVLGYLPPVGWADVATTRDLQTLDASLRGELHGELGKLRGEIGGLSGRVEHQLRVQLYWLVSLVLVLAGLQVSFGVAILTR